MAAYADTMNADATEQLWTAFKALYLAGVASEETFPVGHALDAYCATWEALKAVQGEEDAIARFWDWNNTLPRGIRSDCDPEGN